MWFDPKEITSCDVENTLYFDRMVMVNTVLMNGTSIRCLGIAIISDDEGGRRFITDNIMTSATCLKHDEINRTEVLIRITIYLKPA